MVITYECYDSLYVNLTNRCSNACTFCERNFRDSVTSGVDSLWLEREPALDEIMADFEKRDLDSYPEVVFCGYGEPTERLDTLIEVARRLKKVKPNIVIRINTNGQSDLINNRNTAHELEGLVDIVSISLNAPTAEKYQALCKSRYGEEAFDAVLTFAKNVKKYVKSVVFSVVDTVMPLKDIEECGRIAEECGVDFRVRKYVE